MGFPLTQSTVYANFLGPFVQVNIKSNLPNRQQNRTIIQALFSAGWSGGRGWSSRPFDKAGGGGGGGGGGGFPQKFFLALWAQFGLKKGGAPPGFTTAVDC